MTDGRSVQRLYLRGRYEVEGEPLVRVKPGNVLFVPAETPQLARNIGSVNGAELGTLSSRRGSRSSRWSSARWKERT